MSTPAHHTDLTRMLELERIEANIFRGQSQDLGWGAVFGGQVLGQALSAAASTLPEDRPVHSLHGYFLRQGNASLPVVYEVDRIRDGRSFTTRRVVAIQAGKAIFSLGASFQTHEEGMEHADAMPEVPGPDDLADEWARRGSAAPAPVEARVVDPIDPDAPGIREPVRSVWFRVPGPLPDDQALHRYLLAYISDFHFLTTSLQPHGRSYKTKGLQLASLDHAMWFHRPLRVDEWLLHHVESPFAGGGRGMVRGQWFDQQGRLVASTAQEGLIRQW